MRRRTDCTDRFGVLYGTTNFMTAGLMELFGWLRLEYGEPKEGKGVKVVAIERLPLGDAMMALLQPFYLTNLLPREDDENNAEPRGLLPLFQPFFPDYQRRLARKEWEYREGTYTWKVSLGNVWRRIAAPDDLSVDELATTILAAFKFDSDHLYCFELRQANGRTLRIACPYERDEAVLTDEMALGDLPLAESGMMTLLFDYGDAWRFNVTLETVTTTGKRLKVPRVVAKKGSAPRQYDRYDW